MTAVATPDDYFREVDFHESPVHEIVCQQTDYEVSSIECVVLYMHYAHLMAHFRATGDFKGYKSGLPPHVSEFVRLRFTQVVGFQWINWLYKPGFMGFDPSYIGRKPIYPHPPVNVEFIDATAKEGKWEVRMDFGSFGVYTFLCSKVYTESRFVRTVHESGQMKCYDTASGER